MTTSTPDRDAPLFRVVFDKEADMSRFIRFLNHPDYRGKRATILGYYPEIASAIQRGTQDEASIVREVIGDLYQTRHDAIARAAELIESDLRDARDAFVVLARLMDCENLGEKTFTVIPTLLPFSPIKDDVFYLSIYWSIFKSKDGAVVPSHFAQTAIHEISHLIFFEQLREWEQARGKQLPHPVQHYVKEALTAAVMDQRELKIALNTDGEKRYWGNSELHNVCIQRDKKTQGFVDFIGDAIFREDSPYRSNLFRILDICNGSADQFAEKWKLWNQHLIGATNKELNEQYRNPIAIEVKKNDLR